MRGQRTADPDGQTRREMLGAKNAQHGLDITGVTWLPLAPAFARKQRRAHLVVGFLERLRQKAPTLIDLQTQTQVQLKMLLSSPELRSNALQGFVSRSGAQPLSTQRRSLEVHAAAKVDAAPAKVSEQLFGRYVVPRDNAPLITRMLLYRTLSCWEMGPSRLRLSHNKP